MTAVSDETGRDWLPLKYEDGPDFCTVTFATGAAFALTVHPERMKLMEAALSASPVAQEPVASDDPYFIMLWNWFEKRRGKEDMRAIQNDGGLSVDDLETMLDEHEADLLSQINTPPAPSAGVGADEIAQIIATKCFDPRVIDSSGKPFWKKSQWREAQQAANAILLLLSGGDQK